MYGNQFDGAAAFSGGGFMPTQATQTAADPCSSSFNKNRDAQTLLPLTVKQISKSLMSNDDKINFFIDGVDVNHVKLVGMVFNKIGRVTDVSFVLDDGTGSIECNRWVHEPVDTKEMEAIMNGMYVRVHGQLKGFQGKRQLVVFGIKPLTDFNEITYHFVECMYVHSYNTKVGGGNQAYMSSAAVNPSLQGYRQTAPSNQFTSRYMVEGFMGVDKQVLDYLQLPGSLARDSGVHQEELVIQLGFPLDKILYITLTLHQNSIMKLAMTSLVLSFFMTGRCSKFWLVRG